MKNKVLKAGIGYTFGNYLLKGLSFLTLPIFARLLTTEDYGIYNIYLSYESIIYIILGLTFHASFRNAKYKYKDKFNEYVSNCVLVTLISLGIWLLMSNIFYSLYKDIINLNRIAINLLLFHSFGTTILTDYNTYVGIDYQYQSFLKISAINALSNIILSIIFILTIFDSERYLGRIMGTAIPIILISIIISILFFKKAKPTIKKEYTKYAFKYSLPIIPHGLSQIVLSQFDRIMINTMVGASQAGIYSFAYNIFSIVSVTGASIDQVWQPWFYEKMAEKNLRAIYHRANELIIGMGILISCIILVSPEIIHVLGTEAYDEAKYVVIPILIGGYFTFLYNIPASVEYYYAKTKFIAVGTMLAALLNILLNSLVIPIYGYVAAAYTTLVTYFLYFLFHSILAFYIEKKMVFSILKTFFISFSMILTAIITFVFMEKFVYRWGIVGLFIITSIFWIENKYHILNKKK